MGQKRAAIILAAGKFITYELFEVKGPALLLEVNLCLLGLHLWLEAANVSRAICVVGSDNDDVKEAAENLGLDIAIQQQQLGNSKRCLWLLKKC